MSYTFTISASTPLSMEQLKSALPGDNFKCVEEGDMVDGIQHFYLDQISCRGIELSFDEDGYGVRIFTASSREDHDLARKIIRSLAALTSAPITGEDGAKYELDTLYGAYSDKYIEQTIERELDLLLNVVDSKDSVALSGVFRDIHIGKAFAAKLRGIGQKRERERFFFDKFRSLQYIDENVDFIPNIMVIDNDKKFAVWGPDTRYFFPSTQYLGIPTEKQVLFVPFQHLKTLGGDHVSLIDETQAFVSPISEQEFKQIAERALTLAEFSVDC